MVRNYLKVAIRYLFRNKGYTAINILGLTLGTTCCVLIMLFVRSEWSYDKFHSNSGRIYRLWQHEKWNGEDFINTVTPLSAAQVIQFTYPEVESTCRIFSFNPIVKAGDNSFTDAVRMVDSSFFKVFDFELISGNSNNPFATPNTVILTRETARKYFGKEDPMGKNIELQLRNDKVLFTVGGIIESPPENSSIKYNLLISYSQNDHYMFGQGALKSWFNVQTETYIMLKKGVTGPALEEKFPAMVKNYLAEDYKEGAFVFHLQPIRDIHLNTKLPAGNEPISNPKYSYILATIGIMILLVACVNFIMLSVGRSTTRAMEVGVRKVMGAGRKQLMRQYWGEAWLLTIISVVIGLGAAYFLVPAFNQLVQRNLSLRLDIQFLAFCFGMIALIALIAGIYPAIILSGFKPVEVLKGKLKLKGNAGWLRQGLIVGQFVVSIGMIICTLAVGKQMNYLHNKDLGYKKDQVVVVATNKTISQGTKLGELFRTELLKHPEVSAATISLYSFAETPWVELGYTDQNKTYRAFQFNSIDAHFIPTMGLKMVQGRAFSADNLADLTNAAIVNEAFVKEFKLSDPVGKKLPGPFDQQIIGVVKDFNYMSLHNKVKPLMLAIKIDSISRKTENISFQSPPQPHISVVMKAGNIANNLAVLRTAWKSVAPDQDLDYRFLDESIASLYEAEQRTSRIVKIASWLSIFIACMGLFGLATLTVTRRTKEIGIRKVLGAKSSTIVGLLSRDFVRLIIIASLLAFPLAGWFMNDWLNDFAYRTTIGWWVYPVAGLIALAIALLTTGFQAVRAARMNPVKSLRTE